MAIGKECAKECGDFVVVGKDIISVQTVPHRKHCLQHIINIVSMLGATCRVAVFRREQEKGRCRLFKEDLIVLGNPNSINLRELNMM